MEKIIIKTTDAPLPIGPYSQAVKIGNLLFVSGQIPVCPSTGKIESNDIKSQTKQVMENIKAILNAANCTFENVVKVTIFITDMNNFPFVNEVYSTYFKENFPARETVQVSKLPLNSNIEISVIAVLNN